MKPEGCPGSRAFRTSPPATGFSRRGEAPPLSTDTQDDTPLRCEQLFEASMDAYGRAWDRAKSGGVKATEAVLDPFDIDEPYPSFLRDIGQLTMRKLRAGVKFVTRHES